MEDFNDMKDVNKRGISPLIATVLIIGFTVALAAVIMIYGQEFIMDMQEGDPVSVPFLISGEVGNVSVQECVLSGGELVDGNCLVEGSLVNFCVWECLSVFGGGVLEEDFSTGDEVGDFFKLRCFDFCGVV